jgi:hypothetical protein
VSHRTLKIRNSGFIFISLLAKYLVLRAGRGGDEKRNSFKNC